MGINLKKQECTPLKGIFTIDYNMRDYSDDPCFKRAKERAQANLAKYGIPEEFVAIAKSRTVLITENE